MKQIKTALNIILLAALAGCAAPSPSKVTVEQPVGPDLAPPRVDPGKGRGQLVVYTATEINDQVDAYSPTHSSYSIYTMDEKLVKRVDNRSGSFYQNPEPVPLTPGKYKIKGRATNSGEVTVPVIVEEKKTTIVDLEGTHLPQHKPTGAGQWIRLPNGQVIGMRVE
jgi:hypothetical protein